MGCSSPVILGWSPDEPIDFGETIRRRLRYFSADGSPIDLSDAVASVHSSEPAIIKDEAEISIGEDEDGTYVDFRLDHVHAEQLRRSGKNWFKIYVDFGGGSDDATPELQIRLRR